MEEKKYTITVRDETADASDVPVSGASGTGGGGGAVAPGESVSASKARQGDSKGAIACGLVAVQQIKPYVDNLIGFRISQIQLETGSAEAQQRAQTLFGIANTASSIVTAGIAGGPYAAAAAAVITLGSALVSTAQAQQTLGLQRAVEAENISLRRSRLGASTNRSRNGGTA